MKRIFYYILCLSLWACSSETKQVSENKITINPEDAIQIANTDDLLDTIGCALIPLADTEIPISDDIRFHVSDDRLYISDLMTNCLHVFKEDGTRLFTINNRGQAGDEYVQLTDFFVTDMEIIILDQDSQKVMFFDLEGNFNNSTNIREYWGNGVATIDEDVILINESSTSESGSFHFFCIDRDGSLKDKYYHFEKDYAFGSNKTTAKSDKEVLFCQAPVNTIYQLNADGCTPILDIDFGGREIPEEYYSRDLRWLMKNNLHHHYILGIEHIFGNSKYLVMSYSYNSKSYWIVYDRINKKIVKHCRSLSVNNMYQMGWSSFDIQDDYLYVFIPSYLYRQLMEILMPTIEMETRYKDEMLALNDSISDDDNPIVFRYKFK